MATIITLSNHKGGVGKTTSTLNIGAGLNQLGKKVLFIDLDPQANLTAGLGIKNVTSSIYDYLKNTKPLQTISVEEGMDLIPATSELSFAELELSTEAGREYILEELIEPLRDKYDYILIDTPPSLGLLTINALTASNKVFIPIDALYYAMLGVSKLVDLIKSIKKRVNKKLEIGGVFLTMYDKRKILHQNVHTNVQDYFGNLLFTSYIRDNIALAEAATVGKNIFAYDPESNGAKDYEALCKEILSRS
ncbi:MAG: ParA family protein [Candidatus Amoebophilus sp.]